MIFVSGGNGFIGSHVIDCLLDKGYKVLSFDREHTEFREGVTQFLGDIRDTNAVDEAVSKCEGAINLAGLLGTAEAVNNPRPAAETNIFGGLNFLEACRNHKVKGVQIAVGNFFMNNTYSITKTTIERFALMFNKEHNTKVAIVRGLNAFGERQHHQPIRKITPNFIVKSLQNKPIEIYGDGEQVMDMIYVGDLAEILVRALVMDHKTYDKVFEAGTGIPTTVNQIADMVNKATGNENRHIHLPMRAGETDRAIVIGHPETLKPLGMDKGLRSFENMISQVVGWYKDNYEWQS